MAQGLRKVTGQLGHRRRRARAELVVLPGAGGLRPLLSLRRPAANQGHRAGRWQT